MLFKLLASILSALMAIAGTAIADQVTTITETNYHTPSFFKDQIEGFTVGNTLPSGIPVHFVYVEDCAAPASSADTTITTVSTSSFYYTVSTSATLTSTYIECEADSCSSKYSYSEVPTTYSTLAYVTYTTTFCPEADATEDPVTVVKSTESTFTVSSYAAVTNTVTRCMKGVCSSYESVTSSPTVYVTAEMVEYSTVDSTKTRQNDITVNVSADPITVNEKDLVTTTKTIYEASTTPTSIYSGITTTQSLTTKSDPLVTQSPVYSSRSSTIKTSFSTGVTISSTNSSSLSGSLSSDGSFSTVGSDSKATKLTKADPASKTVTNSILPKSQSFSSGYFNISSSYEPSTSNMLSMTSLLISSEASGSALLPESSTLGSSSLSSSLESSSLSSSASKASSSLQSVATSEVYSGDLFVAVSTDEPSAVFTRGTLPLELPEGVNSDDSPIDTNKFWDNLILGSQTDMIWTYPYGMHWSNSNNAQGFALQHTIIEDRVYGSQDTNNAGVDSYYYNPIDITELLISASTFSSGNFMSISNMKSMSVSVQLSASSSDTTNYIEMPLVQGMGFVTSVYHGSLVPEIGSMIGFDSFSQEVISTKNSKRSNILTNILKYRATLYSGSEWLIYVTLPNSSDDFELTVSNSNIVGSKSIDGLIIQAVVAPESSSLEQYYDSSAGMYVTGANVEGSVSGDNAEYKIVYSTEGSSECGNPIIFALPHHVQSLTSACSASALGIQLPSTTKGNMTAFLTNELIMSETLESSISFLPWSQTMTGKLSYTADQLNLIVEAANSELNVNIAETVASLDSTYSSGKVIDKYAYILLVLSEIIGDEEATNSTLSAIKDAFTPFLENKQYYPFMYDQRYKGVTSTANNNGDTGADYGSGYYNDHHFHYGYYVHAAAVVGYVDKKLGGTWAEDNKDWVNALIRDVANPSEDDTYFPVSRMFDWFQGHSWAAGLFASGDGKNEESSSEDYNFAYGMKMWGSVIGDGSMESRGSLMLSIMSRAMNMYFYYKSDNEVEPSQILPNKVSGIFFENKVTYTTYFGTPDQNPEYVHGIHMLPITPASSLIRIPSYVEQEWDDQISTFISKVDSGWTGILRLNQALYDPSSSYSFFSSDSWSNNYLDDGQSRTWSLAYSAGVMNASS